MQTPTSELLPAIEPSRDALLIALRPLLSNDLILTMAESDVLIPNEVRANQNALAGIRDSGIVPGCLPWNPAEVCNLLRWERRDDQLSSTMKLFGCWILIRAYVQPESMRSGMVDDGDQHTIVALTEAALDLGPDFALHSARFFYWAYLALVAAGEHRIQARPFYLFGLLITAAATPRAIPEHTLSAIWDRLQSEEAHVRAEFLVNDWYGAESRDFSLWLLGLAGDNLNRFQQRCYKLVQRLGSVSNSRASETACRETSMNDMLTRWESVEPAGEI